MSEPQRLSVAIREVREHLMPDRPVDPKPEEPKTKAVPPAAFAAAEIAEECS